MKNNCPILKCKEFFIDGKPKGCTDFTNCNFFLNELHQYCAKISKIKITKMKYGIQKVRIYKCDKCKYKQLCENNKLRTKIWTNGGYKQ